jgi:hypothetical protein
VKYSNSGPSVSPKSAGFSRKTMAQKDVTGWIDTRLLHLDRRRLWYEVLTGLYRKVGLVRLLVAALVDNHER